MNTQIQKILSEVELIMEARKNTPVEELVKQQVATSYDYESLAENSLSFKRDLMTFGRVPYSLSNGSVLTICRPLLCFEEKDDNFKAVRYEVEKKFWEKKLAGECKEMALVATLSLELF